MSTQETLEHNDNVLDNQLAIIMEGDEPEPKEQLDEDQLDEWRQQFSFLEDSVILEDLD